MQIKNSAISHFESLSVTLLSFSGLFIRNCNFVASFGFAALDDVASAFGFHPFAEAVDFASFSGAWLVCSFWHSFGN